MKQHTPIISYHMISAPRLYRRQRGAAMVLVMLSVVIGFTLGLTYLATATRHTQVVRNIEDHNQARLISDAGLQLAIAYIEHEPGAWVDRGPGVWVEEEGLLGGVITVEASFDADAYLVEVPVVDPSFEMESKFLSTPFLFPPMSGTIGGWDVRRTSLLSSVTGLTVPQVGTPSYISATEGSQVARVVYPVSVLGTASFSQTLASAPQPNTSYRLCVSVGKPNVASILAQVEIRLWSGATLLASSSDSTLLTLLNLNGSTQDYQLSVDTGDTPPTDPLRIELYSESVVGLLSTVFFDDVRLYIENETPVTLTASAAYNGTTHRTQSVVLPQGAASPATILSWRDH